MQMQIRRLALVAASAVLALIGAEETRWTR